MKDKEAIAGVVLAAGASRRLGRPKQTAMFAGEPLVRTAVRTLCESHCAAVAVVVGAHAEATKAALTGLRPTVLANEEWLEGIASSIRLATTWAAAGSYAGLLLSVCDQPFLTTGHINALLAAFRAQRRPIGSAYAGTVGVPAVFGSGEFPSLMQLRGDRGASVLLRGAAIDWPLGATDIDTEHALTSAVAARARGQPR